MKTKQFLFLMCSLLLLFGAVGCDKKGNSDTPDDTIYTGQVIDASINATCTSIIEIIEILDGQKKSLTVGEWISFKLQDSEAKPRPEIGTIVKFQILKLKEPEKHFSFGECIEPRYYAVIKLID